MHRLLLHRENELKAIAEALAEVTSGRPAVVIVEGSHGMGKTQLLQAVHAQTGADVLTLRARCHAAENGFALGVVRQLFDPVIGSDRFGGSTPDVVERLADPGQGGGPDFLYGLYRATRTLTSMRSLLIMVDDFTFADEQSAQWLAYLARRMDELPVGIVLTGDPAVRGGEGLTAELHALPYTRRLSLAPLCASCGETAVATSFGTPVDASFAAACHRLASGNPLILGELCDRLKRIGVAPDRTGIAAVARQGPGVLWETMGPWLRRHRPDRVELLESLAVLGAGADLETASMMCGTEQAALSDVEAELRALGLLDDEGVRLGYPELRGAILAGMDPGLRNVLHGRAADLLFRIGSAPQLAAEHMMSLGAKAAGGPANGREVLRRAAREAVTRQEWDVAARYLRRVLLEPGDDGTTGRTIAELGAVEMHRDVPAGIRCFRTLSERGGPPAERFFALEPFADLLLTLESAEAGRFQTRALNALPAGAGRGLPPRPALRVAAQALCSGNRVNIRPAMEAARASSAENRGTTGVSGTAEEFNAARAIVLAMRGRHRARAVRHARQSWESAGGPAGRSSSAWAGTLALAMADELADAALHAERQLVYARQRRSPSELVLALIGKAEIDFRLGNLNSSYRAAVEAGECAPSVGADGLRVLARCCATRVLIERGMHDTPDAALGELDPHEFAHPLVRALYLEIHGRHELACGRLREGLQSLLESGQHLLAHGIVNPACIPWQGRAVLTHLALREIRPARQLAEIQLATARAWGAPSTLGRALTIAAATCPISVRIPMLREATALLADGPAKLEHARTLAALGAALVDAGKDREARDVLRAGLEAADRCSAGRLRARMESRLSAAGGRPRELSDPAHVPLTWAELRVVRLIVQGMSNMEAAETLSLSKRTVDTHLARIYRKLGIGNRAQLLPALRSTGDDI